MTFDSCILCKKGGSCLKAGDIIAGKYRVIRELGSGGEGTVYLAEHLMTDVLRAIKISVHSLERRSLHELEMMKKVSHPSLPRIIDVEREEFGLCLVMEYVEGRSLLDYGKQSPVTEKFFYHAAEQLLDALEYLHTGQFPMLHLDVKPSNIIVRGDGSLVLLDLGAAMPVSSVKEGRGCYGTVGYAAPEQFDRSMLLTVRTDLYGFGATMYFLLYGRKCGETARTGRARDSPEYWRRRAERLILACMEKEPEKRPASAGEVRKRLEVIKCRASRRRKVIQILSALALLWGVLLFSGREFGKEGTGGKDVQQKYEYFLEEAERSGDIRAFESYKKAILLCPDRLDVFFDCISRITSDLVFTLDEEAELQSLLNLRTGSEGNCAYDEIRKQGEMFGDFAYQLGIAYWYFYEGAGGRAAASSWFSRAEYAASENGCTDIWAREASIYARIGSYYEKLGKQELPGTDTVSPADYWADLEELGIICSTKKDERTGKAVKKSILEERLNLLIFEAVSLKEAGIREQELLDSIHEMEEQGADQLLTGRCEDAEYAVRRAYESDRKGTDE